MTGRLNGLTGQSLCNCSQPNNQLDNLTLQHQICNLSVLDFKTTSNHDVDHTLSSESDGLNSSPISQNRTEHSPSNTVQNSQVLADRPSNRRSVQLDIVNQFKPTEPIALESLSDLFDEKLLYNAPNQHIEANEDIQDTKVPGIVIDNDRPIANLKHVLLHRMIHTTNSVNHIRINTPINYNAFSIDSERLSNRQNNSLMFYHDRTTNLTCLLDSGSQISVIPRHPDDKVDSNAKYELTGAGGHKIQTYGKQIIKLKLGNKYYRWTFVKADVKNAIIGIDFLKCHRLLVDPESNSLINKETLEEVKCTTTDESSKCLNIEITDPIMKLLEERPELTSEKSTFSNQKHNVVHFIHTEGGPVKAPIRHYNPKIQQVIRDTFHEYLELGIVRHSDSDWSSPLAIVKKKDNQYRVCGDYRFLNKVSKMDNYGIPYLPAFNSLMHGSTVFSKLDLLKAYHQINVYHKHVHKTAVSTPIGLFEFLKMPFGLKTAGQTMQRFVDMVLGKFYKFVFVYIDDIIIFSKNEQDHHEHLKTVFDQLSTFGLKINIKKSEFCKPKLNFLGHEVDQHGVKPDQSKVNSIINMPIPSTYGQIKRYLGMVTYYSKHIEHFASLRSSLNVYLAKPKQWKNRSIKLTDKQLNDFHQINRQLANASLLYHPRLDTTLTLHTDASSVGVGAVLNQLNPDLEQLEPLFFFSKKLDQNWKDHPIYQKELEAAFLAVKRLNKFLIGQKTILYTDNQALFKALNNPKEQSPVDVRKMMFITQYIDEVRYVSGTDNVIADALSRLECDQITLNAMRLDAKIDYKFLFESQQKDQFLRSQSDNDKYKYKLIQADDQEYRMAFFVSSGFKELIYVPLSAREMIMSAYHKLFHPGYKSTSRLIAQAFYWNTLNTDVRQFVKHCLDCQQAKTTRKNQIPPSRISVPDQRFKQIHMDLVGPLPPVDGCRYIMTFIDRFSRFTVAQPVDSIDTMSVWSTLVNSWIKYFGCPQRVTTDRGRQFDNPLFRSLCKNFNIKLNHTTSYHPQSNGIVEREHRKLKNSLRSLRDSDWKDRLPIVVIGWNNAIREDFLKSPSQLLYGTSTRLPIEFFEPPTSMLITPDIARSYQQELDVFRSYNTSQHSNRYPTFTQPGLGQAKYVWVRNENVHGLDMLYNGPFEILERKDDYYVIKKKTTNSSTDTVHISRVKPAFLINSD